jgi:hypothetical protein
LRAAGKFDRVHCSLEPGHQRQIKFAPLPKLSAFARPFLPAVHITADGRRRVDLFVRRKHVTHPRTQACRSSTQARAHARTHARTSTPPKLQPSPFQTRRRLQTGSEASRISVRTPLLHPLTHTSVAFSSWLSSPLLCSASHLSLTMSLAHMTVASSVLLCRSLICVYSSSLLCRSLICRSSSPLLCSASPGLLGD